MTANLVVWPVFSSELVHSRLYEKVSLDLALLISPWLGIWWMTSVIYHCSLLGFLRINSLNFHFLKPVKNTGEWHQLFGFLNRFSKDLVNDCCEISPAYPNLSKIPLLDATWLLAFWSGDLWICFWEIWLLVPITGE